MFKQSNGFNLGEVSGKLITMASDNVRNGVYATINKIWEPLTSKNVVFMVNPEYYEYIQYEVLSTFIKQSYTLDMSGSYIKNTPKEAFKENEMIALKFCESKVNEYCRIVRELEESKVHSEITSILSVHSTDVLVIKIPTLVKEIDTFVADIIATTKASSVDVYFITECTDVAKNLIKDGKDIVFPVTKKTTMLSSLVDIVYLAVEDKVIKVKERGTDV